MKAKDSNYCSIKRIIACLFIFMILSYLFAFIYRPYYCPKQSFSFSVHQQDNSAISSLGPTPKKTNSNTTPNSLEKTNLSHIVFGIAASAKLWNKRKQYISLWWRPNEMRGNVWLDEHVKVEPNDNDLPPLRISSDTLKFKYKRKGGHRSAIRITRIVSETLRLGMKDVRWFVMGDDDTFFVPDNLVKVLQKYDHNSYYYIGSTSESHLQNIDFSYNMAYGGGGFAISYPLAVALEKMQDKCIQRYPGLYGSDDRIQACMAELGVPLTKEKGFHQFDVYGNLVGILAAHPIAPLVSLHHLDMEANYMFPNTKDKVKALKRLRRPMKMDSAGLMQQSICYDKNRNWTVSVSWGYVVQIFQGTFLARDMELPRRTFVDWHHKVDDIAFSFNTRPNSMHKCEIPFVYYISTATKSSNKNEIATEYLPYQTPLSNCEWQMSTPPQIKRVEVYKTPNPYLWDKPPRRNCCRILSSNKRGTMVIDVGECKEDEIIAL
ncbi:hypothetical protein ACB098_09G059000 [Castanea mollissima]